MKIEILYSELYIYGEKEAALFFAQIMKQKGHDVIFTSYHDIPQFANSKVDCIYISVMAEKFLDKVIYKLLPYKNQLIDAIENNTYLIGFGSSLDLFAKKLTLINSVFDKEDSIKPSLEIFDYEAIRNYKKRKASMSAFKMDGVEDVVLGSNISFSSYNYLEKDNKLYDFIRRGDSSFEGYRYKNVYLFEVVGCLFILNPLLLKYFLNEWEETFDFKNKELFLRSYQEKKKLWIKYKKI